MKTPARSLSIAQTVLHVTLIVSGILALCSTSAAQTWHRAKSAPYAAIDNMFASDSLMVSIIDPQKVWASGVHSGEWEYRGSFDIRMNNLPVSITSGVIVGGRLILGTTHAKPHIPGLEIRMIGGLYASDDTGRTWYNLALRDTAVYAIKTAGSDGVIALVSTDGPYGRRMYLMKSSDGGVSWSKTTDVPGQTSQSEIRPGGVAASWSGDIAVVYKSSLFLSTDFGNSWRLVRDSIATDAFVTFDAAGRLYLLNLRRGDGLYISEDKGSSWSRADTPPNQYPIGDIAATPLGAVLVGTQYQGAWRWTPGSGEWQRIGPNGKVPRIIVIADRALIASSPRGVYSSTDNAMTWKQASEGLPSLRPGSFARFGERTIVAGPIAPGASSEDEGETWTGEAIERMKFPGRELPPYQVVALKNGMLAAGTQAGVGFLDRDSTTWRYVVPGFIRGRDPDKQVQRISSEVNGYIFAYTGNHMYRGGPFGGWTAVEKGLWFRSIAAATPGRLVAAVETGAPVGLQGWEGPGLFFSQNDGLTWEDRGNGKPYYDVAAFADGSIAATTDGIIEFWGKNGVSRLPLPISYPLRASSILIIEPSTLILGVSDTRGGGDVQGSGILRSDDRGLSWRPMSDGLDSTSVWTLARISPTRLLATTSIGIYYLDLVSLHVASARDHGAELTLSASYQAGSDLLRIQGSRSHGGTLHYSVLNSAGQTVITQREYAASGRFDAAISVSGFPSGLYFIQARVEGSVEYVTAGVSVVR